MFGIDSKPVLPMRLVVGVDPGQDTSGIACQLRDAQGKKLHLTSFTMRSERKGQWWPDYLDYVTAVLPRFVRTRGLEVRVVVEYTSKFGAKVWGGGMCVAYEVLRQLYPITYYRHRKDVLPLTPPRWRKIFREAYEVPGPRKGEEKQWAVDNATWLWDSKPGSDHEAEARLLCECGFLL